jgi:hypothetical protein
MITYAGVELPAPTAEAAAWIAANIRLSDIEEMLQPDAEGPTMRTFQTRSWMKNDLRVEVGTLAWPQGASRWAIGHFLAHGSQLDAIRAAAYGGSSGNQSVPQPLVMGDPSIPLGTITTNLYLLPPRPLAQFTEPTTLYLLTLVDERFYWWNKTLDYAVVGGTTQWTDLFAAIGTALGISILLEVYPAAYLTPPASLTTRYDYIPTLLDAASASLGQNIVRDLDGTVSSVGTGTAGTLDALNLANNFPVLAGGYFQTQ